MATAVLFYESSNGRSPVREFLESLPPKVFAKCEAYMERCVLEHDWSKGPPPPNFSKPVRGRIHELRPEWSGTEYRFLYAHVESGFLLLHAIKKKRQRLSDVDIKTAEERLGDFEQRFER